MKIPQVKQLPSGAWHCQVRLKGEDGKLQSISITHEDKKVVEAQAMAYKSGLATVKKAPAALTLRKLIDDHIAAKSNVLSPSTIRGYRIIQRNRFQDVMDKPLTSIKNWNKVVNAEAALCAPKTLKNAWGLVSPLLRKRGVDVAGVSLPAVPPSRIAYLTFEQIGTFIDAVYPTQFAVPALLALMSMRLSEITALRWEDIPPNPQFIRTSGAVVPDADNKMVHKKSGKTQASSRNIPILIPELAQAIERDRQPNGSVMPYNHQTLRRGIDRICEDNDLPQVHIHGLRHSFASLAHHLNMPEKIAMEIGGWSDLGTMRKIYQHIAQDDITRYQTEMAQFYANRKSNTES